MIIIGCFSLGGNRYEASAALSNLEAEVAYDPMDMETVTVCCRGAAPVRAHRMEIGAFASKVPPVPLGMTGTIPETSRLLDALEKKYREDHEQMARRFVGPSVRFAETAFRACGTVTCWGAVLCRSPAFFVLRDILSQRWRDGQQ